MKKGDRIRFNHNSKNHGKYGTIDFVDLMGNIIIEGDEELRTKSGSYRKKVSCHVSESKIVDIISRDDSNVVKVSFGNRISFGDRR